MTDTSAKLEPVKGGRLTIARSRGVLSGFLLVLLGAWGALVPFFGPYFDFGYTPNSGFQWTEGRGWFEVAPGAVALLAGLILIVSANRLVTTTAAWVAIAAGGWFVIGPEVVDQVSLGSLGTPISTGQTTVSFELIGLFTGVGAVIIAVAAFALGRLSTRSVGDVRAAQRRRDAHARDEAAAAEAARVDDEMKSRQQAERAGVADAGRHGDYVRNDDVRNADVRNDDGVGNGVERNGVPRSERSQADDTATTTTVDHGGATSDDGSDQRQISMDEMRRQHDIRSS